MTLDEEKQKEQNEPSIKTKIESSWEFVTKRLNRVANYRQVCSNCFVFTFWDLNRRISEYLKFLNYKSYSLEVNLNF